MTGEITLSPESVFFGFVKKGNTPPRRVTISNDSPEELNVKDIEYPQEYLSVELIVLEKGRKFAIEATLKPDAPKGKVEENIKLHTDSEREPTIEIPVYAMIEE